MSKPITSLKEGLILVFAGSPGSGKGTYGKLLAERWGFTHLSVGDLVRAELSRSSLDQESRIRASRGLLLSDRLVATLCEREIRSSPSQKSWIIDGFPRTVGQVQMLHEFAKPHACVNFQLPDTIILKKLLGRRLCKLCGKNFNLAGIHDAPYDMPAILPSSDCSTCKGDAPLLKRADDTEETIQQRLDIHETTTRPVIDQYEQQGILLNFEVIKGIKDMPRLESSLLSFLQDKYGGNIERFFPISAEPSHPRFEQAAQPHPHGV
ncbi:hypothetical protein Emed_003401 [Eimeria media]